MNDGQGAGFGIIASGTIIVILLIVIGTVSHNFILLAHFDSHFFAGDTRKLSLLSVLMLTGISNVMTIQDHIGSCATFIIRYIPTALIILLLFAVYFALRTIRDFINSEPESYHYLSLFINFVCIIVSAEVILCLTSFLLTWNAVHSLEEAVINDLVAYPFSSAGSTFGMKHGRA